MDAPTATTLPLRFTPPAWWPRPSVDWLAANQGWNPPPGWTPVANLAPAPPGWAFWSQDPVGWPLLTGALRRRFRDGIILSSIAFVAGVVLTFAPLVLHIHVAIQFIFWGAILFSPFSIVRYARALRRVDAAFLGTTTARAAEIRRNLENSTYSDHLRTNPSEPLTFEAFHARRHAEAWSFTGQWPLDQHHLGVTDEFFRGVAAANRFNTRRVVTSVVSTVAVVALLVGVVAATHWAAQRSGTTTANSGGSSQVAGSITKLPAADARCQTGDDCWLVQLEAGPSCTTATVTVTFVPADTSVSPTTRTLPFPVTSSRLGITMREPAGRMSDLRLESASCTATT